MAARADKNTTHINKQAAGKWLVGLYQRQTKLYQTKLTVNHL